MRTLRLISTTAAMCGRTQENEMRKTFLATTAMAVVSLAVGFGGIAAAQSQMGNESGKGTGAAPGTTAPG